jgi:hypothetical protein
MIPSEIKEFDLPASRLETEKVPEPQESYDRQELFELHHKRWHNYVLHRKHIGLSWHNKRALRQTFKSELLPEAELRRCLFNQLLNLSNLLSFLFADRPRRSWLLYALS